MTVTARWYKAIYWYLHSVCFVGPPGSDEEDFFDALDYQAEEFEVALPHNQPKHRYALVSCPVLDFFKTYFESWIPTSKDCNSSIMYTVRNLPL